MKNSHYIPRLILRHFSSRKGKINLYDLTDKSACFDIKIENAFAIKGFYPDVVEEEFNRKTEGSFGNILNNIILNSKQKEIRLNRIQVQAVKKFLLLLIIRSIHQDAWIEGEKRFEETMAEIDRKFGVTENLIFTFKEKKISGESAHDYWLRTIRCILDSPNGLPEEIEKDPNATQMAWRWAWVVKSGYLAFWSSNGTGIDFLVTDVGMTSESELAIGKDQTWNPMKLQSLLVSLGRLPNTPEYALARDQIAQAAVRQAFFHENFMEFPISSKLMIALVNPYYKVSHFAKNLNLPFTEFERLTKLSNKRAFEPNIVKYVQIGDYRDDDVFVYKIHNLTRENCIYLNALTLDRIDTTLGFTDPRMILSSLKFYQNVPGKLNDYSRLLEMINMDKNNV